MRVLSTGSYRTEIEIALDVASLGQVVDTALRQGAVRDLAVEDAPLDAVIRTMYIEVEGPDYFSRPDPNDEVMEDD